MYARIQIHNLSQPAIFAFAYLKLYTKKTLSSCLQRCFNPCAYKCGSES